MPFSIRPYSRFPVQCAVTYNAGPFQGQGAVWNLSCSGWRLSGNLPMRPGETISLTVILSNMQRIEALEAVVEEGQIAAPPNHPMNQITEASIRIRIHATTHTPGSEDGGILIGSAHVASSEDHEPRGCVDVGSVSVRRRRPI